VGEEIQTREWQVIAAVEHRIEAQVGNQLEVLSFPFVGGNLSQTNLSDLAGVANGFSH
jgi:hypothetical protein